jgi:hypothetical protein
MFEPCSVGISANDPAWSSDLPHLGHSVLAVIEIPVRHQQRPRPPGPRQNSEGPAQVRRLRRRRFDSAAGGQLSRSSHTLPPSRDRPDREGRASLVRTSGRGAIANQAPPKASQAHRRMRRRPHRARQRSRSHDEAAPEGSGAASSSHGSARMSRKDGPRRGLAVSPAITQRSRTGRALPDQEALTCEFVSALEWLDAPGRSLQPVPCGTQ